MIYWTPMSGSYFLKGSILEKYGKFGENGRFSGRIWPDRVCSTPLSGLSSPWQHSDKQNQPGVTAWLGPYLPIT